MIFHSKIVVDACSYVYYSKYILISQLNLDLNFIVYILYGAEQEGRTEVEEREEDGKSSPEGAGSSKQWNNSGRSLLY